MSAPELRTPAEWSAQDGVTVMDPDGWRGTRTLPAKSWDEPISHDEWQQRLSVSTHSLRTVPAEQTNVIDQVACRLLPPHVNVSASPEYELRHPTGQADTFTDIGDANDFRDQFFPDSKLFRREVTFVEIRSPWTEVTA